MDNGNRNDLALSSNEALTGQWLRRYPRLLESPSTVWLVERQHGRTCSCGLAQSVWSSSAAKGQTGRQAWGLINPDSTSEHNEASNSNAYKHLAGIKPGPLH